jgi:hypothetical protein
MKTAQPHITEEKIAAYRAAAFSFLMWLLSVIFALGAPRRSRRLKRFLTRCERRVEMILFLVAHRRAGPVRRPRTLRPGSVPPGFRRAQPTPRLLFKTARIRARGQSLRQRALRLLHVMAAPERFVARFLKRILKGLCPRRFVAAAPPALAFVALASPTPPAFADSS